MRITKAVKLHLKNDSGVSAIVGQRVYLRRAPQAAAYPRVTVSIASCSWPTRSNAPRSAGTILDVKARLQVDSWSMDEDEVDTLSEMISDALDDFRGTMQGVVVKRALQDDERDNYDSLRDASDDGVHRITQDYEIIFQQPVA